MTIPIRYFQLLFLLISEIILISEYYSLASESQMATGVISTNIIVIIASISIYLLNLHNPRYLKGQIITISFIFLFSFFVVHFFNYIGWLFLPNDYKFLSSHVVNKASTLSAAAFIGCLIGMIICKHPFSDTKRNYRLKIGTVPPFFMIVCLSLFIIFTDKRYFSAGGNGALVNDIGWNPIGSASYNMCIAYVIANVVVVVYDNWGRKLSLKQYFNKYPIAYYILTIFYLLLVVLSGDRGPIVDIIVAYSLGFILINKTKPKIIILIVIAIFAIFTLKYLSFLRNNSDALSIEKLGVINDRMSRFHEENIPVIGDMREMSDVVDAYHLVYEFGQNYSIIYGFGTLTQILAVLPGIRYIIMSSTGIPPSLYSTSEIATALLGKNYGAGTTCVADAYYNFGFIGTIIFFILVGFFLRKLDLSIYQKGCKLFIFIVAFCFFVKSIYLGRSYFLQPVTLIMYTFLIVWLTKHMNNKKKLTDENHPIY